MKPPSFRNTFRTIVCTLLAGYLLLLGFLNFSPTEQYMSRVVAQMLSEKIGSEVTIENIEVGLFNRLIINGIEVKDKRNKSLLKSRVASAKVSLRSLFQKQLVIRTVSLLDAQVNVYKETKESPLNIQFLIDALSSKDKNKPSSLNIATNSIILRRVEFWYDELYKAETPHLFNPSHIKVHNLNANISIKCLTPDKIKLRSRFLSFKEHSGFIVDNLQFKVEADKHKALIEHFNLQMPHTFVKQDQLNLTYDITRGFNNLLKTLSFKADFKNVRVSGSDIKPFIKALPHTPQLSLITDFAISLTPSQISLSNVYLRTLNKSVTLTGKVKYNNWQGINKELHFGLEKLNVDSSFIREILPLINNEQASSMLFNIGNISANGKGSLNIPLSRAKGDLKVTTNQGSLAIAATLSKKSLNANVRMLKVNTDRIVGNKQLPTNITLNTNIKANWQNAKQPNVLLQGNVNATTWNKYTYNSIALNAQLHHNILRANIVSSDVNCHVSTNIVTCITSQHKVESVQLKSTINRLSLATLGFNTPLGPAVVSGSISASAKGINHNVPEGALSLYNVSIKNGAHGDYHIDNLDISLKNSLEDNGLLSITSDFLDANVEGSLSIKNIKHGFYKILSRSLPNLVNADCNTEADRCWNFNAQLKDTDVFDKLFGIKIGMSDYATLKGVIHSGPERSYVTFFAPQLSIKEQEFHDLSLYFDGKNSNYNCLLQATKRFASQPYKVAIDMHTDNGILNTNVNWHAADNSKYNGSIAFNTHFLPSKRDQKNLNIDILPTTFALSDTIWHISAGNLSFVDKQLSLSNVSINHNDQSLTIDGKVAPNHQDSIVAKLQNIDVSYILDLVNFDAVSFGGKASGIATFTQSNNTPQLHTVLHLPQFYFNDGLMGDAHILANWNKHENRINLNANMLLPNTIDHGTKVKGYVSLAEKGLDLHITPNHTQLDFLNRYIDGIFSHFKGDATGFVRLYGPFKKLDFEGEVKANCQANVIATGVNYKVTDGTMKFEPGAFLFKQFTLSDNQGGVGQVDGALNHTHLKHLTYHFNIDANRLLVYDQPATENFPFSSTTKGTGKIKLEGYPAHFNAKVSIRPDAPTTFTYDLSSQTAQSADERFIRFRDAASLKKKSSDERNNYVEEKEQKDKNEDVGTDVTLNFFIDLNPDANIRIITDNKTGDAITTRGNGLLHAIWNNKSGVEMFGTYTLSRGRYNISIQDIIRKELNLKQGSTIAFTGNPLDADLKLNASYTVNGVSLSDLNYNAGFANKRVRANCLLNINGKAHSPIVNFDLDLQGISEDEKHMVQQLISTDEDMSRQVISLLGVGRFMSANQALSSASAQTQTNQSATAMRSFLSTTITSQLNSAISSVLGEQSKWSFGTNFNPGTEGWNNMEVDGLIQGRLFNDRLLINGNFGYRDHPTYTTSNFVGDFDVRYLLTPRGSVSLRAYSETNDRYFTKSSLTTQGIGLSLQRDFNRFLQLFKPLKRTKNGSKLK